MSSVYLHRNMFWKIHLELIDFHKKNLEREILFFYNKKIKFFTDLTTKVLCIGFTACMVYPVIIDIVYSQFGKTLGFACIVPFTDPHTNIGYLINLANQSLIIAFACYGYVIFIRLYFLLFSHLFANLAVLVEKATELHDHITEFGNAEESRIVSLKLSEMVQLHLGFLRFVV